jgi:hypothetical protein
VAGAAAYADSDPRSRAGSFWHQTDARRLFLARADTAEAVGGSQLLAQAEVQSTMPGRRHRDLYEGSKMLSRSTGPLGSSFNLAAVKEKVEAAMRTHPGQ